MRILGRFVVAFVVAVAASAVVAGLFLPVAGVLEGGEFNCFATGIAECVEAFQWGLLLYGPWFVIVGAVVGTPLLLMLWAWRDTGNA